MKLDLQKGMPNSQNNTLLLRIKINFLQCNSIFESKSRPSTKKLMTFSKNVLPKLCLKQRVGWWKVIGVSYFLYDVNKKCVDIFFMITKLFPFK